MFIVHSFVLAAILYFVMVRAGVYFEKLLYVCVMVCALQSALAFFVPITLVRETATVDPQFEDRSWMDPASAPVEEKRGTMALVINLLFYAALVGFLFYWYKLEPVKAAAVVAAFVAYQVVLGFLIMRLMIMLSSTQQQKIGW
ncbi:MAG: hypothetical protein ACAI35_18970 [Candidatus Methylacidiphilales bacterium]|nr:hypothetical protein [Candidatus Methylacidiphilales bacterium]